MSRISYVNGRFVPHQQASVHVEDRGYQFADGVYEVVLVRNGSLVDAVPHLDRLDRSLAELRIDAPMGRRPLLLLMREMVRCNRVDTGLIYMQVTRGVARRDHPFPREAVPSLVMTCRRLAIPERAALERGVAVITIPDIRWTRCDIRSIALLPNVLGKQQAREAGSHEAWQVGERGDVTEGTSTNAWIVTADGALVTRPRGNRILGGITRHAVIGLAGTLGLTFVERPFSVGEAKAAREAFITSATTFLMPVTRIDDAVIGNGRAGPMSLRLSQAYLAHTEAGGASTR